jgi:hypothetical protein
VLIQTSYHHNSGTPIHGVNCFLRRWQSLSWSTNYLAFMEPKGSLMCSQGSVTVPYSEARWIQSHLISSKFILTLSSHLCLGFSEWSLIFRFFSKFCILFPSLSCILHPWPFHPNNMWWRVKLMKLFNIGPVSYRKINSEIYKRQMLQVGQ